MIQIFNSYNLVTEKVPSTIYGPYKKRKKSIGWLEINFPYRTILKPSNINLASVSMHV